MRRIVWVLLVLLVFAIPWEYSLVFPAPYGNVARVIVLLALAVAIPAVFQAARLRRPAPFHCLVLAFYLWWCCTGFWSVDLISTETSLRGYFQELSIVWLLWEFAESAIDLRTVLRAWVAGSWVLALLTLANFASLEAIAASQIRFAASGQDPNDVARFLDLGLPLAALLFRCEKGWAVRWMALAFLPVGMTAVLLTASRGGFIAALVALAGSALVLGHGRAKAFATGTLALPALVMTLWLVIPRGTLQRLATIPAELQRGDLNQRLAIWSAGWSAFIRAPIRGTGAGTFVSAAHTAPIDTAHSTLLAIAVTGGLCAVFLAVAIVVAAARSVVALRGVLRITLATTLAVWAVASLVATTEESRTTWLLLGVIVLAARLTADNPGAVDASFETTNATAQIVPEADAVVVSS
jgi:O-antigen ligase